MTSINNIQSLTNLHTLQKHSASESKLFNQLSTGKRINKASDDVISSAKAKQLEKAIRSLDAVESNIDTAANKVDTASGGLTNILSNLQSLREMAVRGADDTLSATQRRSLNQQVNESKQEINRLASSVQFDGQNLLDGSQENQRVQVGDGSGDTQTISFESATTENLGVADVDTSSADAATSSIDAIDAAINEVSSRISQQGQKSNLLNEVAASNRETKTNLSQSRSVLEDLDYALALGELKAVQIKKESTTQTLSALLQSSQNIVGKLF